MRALVELEHRHAVFEVMPRHQPGGLELRQHPVHGREPDVLVGLEQRAVDVLGRQVARGAALEDLEDLQARQRHLQTGLAQVLAFHACLSGGSRGQRVAAGAPQSGMMRPMIIPHRRRARLPWARGAALVLLAALLGGCVYRMNIQQGNYLEGKTVDKLEVGMTRTQVRYLLGTPMVPAPFHKDRWDYIYFFQHGRLRKPSQRHLAVFFKEDKVVRFERENVPNSAPQEIGRAS